MRTINPLDDQVTPQALYINRRQFLRSAGIGGLAALLAACQAPASSPTAIPASPIAATATPLATEAPPVYPEQVAPQELAENFNNYYEFSFSKQAVAGLARDFKTEPWTIEVGGLVREAKTFEVKDLLSNFVQDEYVYRMRCVEGWSMVLPWYGFKLSALIDALEPLPEARYIAFTSIYKPEELPGQMGNPDYPWPYTEGLRLDEARHPLTILASGLYQSPLAPQTGAPLRLVVPWKYGFKDIKAITRIEFSAEEPPTMWKTLNSDEYGFYANVNPNVDHPRWSQASEIRLGEEKRIPTEMFNGYKEVADLYAGMDLRKEF